MKIKPPIANRTWIPVETGQPCGCGLSSNFRSLSSRVAFRSALRAFTLLEVMIAMAIFCVAIFAILDLTSVSLSAARRLQAMQVDASSLASALSLTNRLEDGDVLPPEIVAQFEELHPGYTCMGNIYEASSNGLFQVDFEIAGVRNKKVVGSTMSIFLYRPGSGQSLRNRVGR